MVTGIDKRNFIENNVIIGLGGNIGDIQSTLLKAIQLIEIAIGPVFKKSATYQTEAWGVKDQPAFLNEVVSVKTNLDPTQVLSTCLSIEKKLGRNRLNAQKWHQRVIDIDVLFYDDQIIDLPQLEVPHPHLHHRNFVLVPLLEIMPHYIHPKLGKSIIELNEICTDKMQVTRLIG